MDRLNTKHAPELRAYITSDARAARLKTYEEEHDRLQKEVLMLRQRMNEAAVREDVDADEEGKIAKDESLGGQVDNGPKTYDCVEDMPDDVFMAMLESDDMSFFE